MRDNYIGFYPPTSAEMDAIWAEGLVALDANTLLNLYRYTPTTRNQFLKVLESLGDRLWLPYQAGLEFQHHRAEVITQQMKAHDDVISAIKKAHKDLETELRRFTRHSTLNVDDLLRRHRDLTDELEKAVEDRRDSHAKRNNAGDLLTDPIWDRVTSLFQGKVGVPFEPEELDAIYAEGASRFEREIPPGFKDSTKPAPERYGDLVIWKELLREARTKSCAAIFVTDDRKEDWWRIEHGRTLGARVELVNEFYDATSMRVHFYTPDRFLQYAKRGALSSQVSSDAITEARIVGTAPLREMKARLSALRGERMVLEAQLRDTRHHGDLPEVADVSVDAEVSIRELERLQHHRDHLQAVEQTLLEKHHGRDLETEEELLRSIESARVHRAELDREILHLKRAIARSSHSVDTYSERRLALADRIAEIDRHIEFMKARIAQAARMDAP